MWCFTSSHWQLSLHWLTSWQQPETCLEWWCHWWPCSIHYFFKMLDSLPLKFWSTPRAAGWVLPGVPSIKFLVTCSTVQAWNISLPVDSIHVFHTFCGWVSQAVFVPLQLNGGLLGPCCQFVCLGGFQCNANNILHVECTNVVYTCTHATIGIKWNPQVQVVLALLTHTTLHSADVRPHCCTSTAIILMWSPKIAGLFLHIPPS